MFDDASIAGKDTLRFDHGSNLSAVVSPGNRRNGFNWTAMRLLRIRRTCEINPVRSRTDLSASRECPPVLRRRGACGESVDLMEISRQTKPYDDLRGDLRAGYLRGFLIHEELPVRP